MNRLRKIRNDLKMSQTDFAESIGISKPRLSQYENNKRGLPVEVAKKISKKYNITLDEIYNA